MGLNTDVLGAILQIGGRAVSTIEKKRDIRKTAEQESQKDLAKESTARKKEADKLDREERELVMKAQTEQIKDEKKERKETRKTERAEFVRQSDIEAGKIREAKTKREAEKTKSESFEGRYNRWLQGTYKPATEQEAKAFRKKSGPSGKTKEERVPISEKSLADAYHDYIHFPSSTLDLFDSFEDYVAQTEEATKERFRRTADGKVKGDEGDVPGPGEVVGGRGQSVPGPEQAAQTVGNLFDPRSHPLDFPQGYNAITRGDFLNPAGPEITDPTDTLPAEFSPDVNAPAQDPQASSPEGAIDITDQLDPTFKHDPLRNPDAARADALLDRPSNTWAKEDQEFMEEFLQVLGL